MRLLILTLSLFSSFANAQTFGDVPVAVYQLQSGEQVYIKGRTPETEPIEDEEELNKLFYQQHMFNIGFTMGYLFAPDRAFDSTQKPGENPIVTSNNYPALHLEAGVRMPWRYLNRVYVGGDFTFSGEDPPSAGDSQPLSVRYGHLSHTFFGEYDAIIISREQGSAISAGFFSGRSQAEWRGPNLSWEENRSFTEKGLQFRWRTQFAENRHYGGSLYVLAKVSDKGVWSLYYGGIASFGPRFKVSRYKNK